MRHLGNIFSSYVELNLESQISLHNLFEKDLNPKELLINIQLTTQQKVISGETLLFIDEIQACPRAIIALRYFYEEMPELHIIAAGSLFDFAIDKVGVPVGRVSFAQIFPLSFIEFLWAVGEDMLAETLLNDAITKPFADPIHERALRLFGEYIAIGGMPEAILAWREQHTIIKLACASITICCRPMSTILKNMPKNTN